MNDNREIWTILKVLNWTKEYLAGKGVENARLESEWLLSSLLGHDRVGLYLNFDKPLTAVELVDFRSLVARRARREPLQYLLGSQEFMGLDFRVSPAVLIPRHDTEVLVTETVRRGEAKSRIVDIGSGSGCIAIALAKLLPQAEVIGVETSVTALMLARENAARNSVRVSFRGGSLFEPVAGERFDIIVSNPPYIPTAELAGLQPEVRDYEPRLALDGGLDGLDFYRRIIGSASEYLNPCGWLLVEVGLNQAEAVQELFTDSCHFVDIFSARDQAAIERVVGGRVKSD